MKLMWRQWEIRHALAPASQPAVGQAGVQRHFCGIAWGSITHFLGDYQINCLRGSSGHASVYMSMCAWLWPCVLCDRGQYNPKYSKQNHWFLQINLSTHSVLMEAAAAPYRCVSYESHSPVSKVNGPRDTGVLGRNESTSQSCTLCLHGDFCFGPAGSVLLCLFWSQLTARFTSCISGFIALLWNANQKPQVTARIGFWLFGRNFGDVFLVLKSGRQGEKCSRCFLEELKAFVCAGQVWWWEGRLFTEFLQLRKLEVRWSTCTILSLQFLKYLTCSIFESTVGPVFGHSYLKVVCGCQEINKSVCVNFLFWQSPVPSFSTFLLASSSSFAGQILCISSRPHQGLVSLWQVCILMEMQWRKGLCE